VQDRFSDLLIEDVQCPSCLGHAILIWPRSKAETYWPVVCLYCDDVGFVNTGDLVYESQIQRSQAWCETMLDFVSYHVNNVDMWADLAINLKETHVV
jgi:hypothetical protein